MQMEAFSVGVDRLEALEMAYIKGAHHITQMMRYWWLNQRLAWQHIDFSNA